MVKIAPRAAALSMLAPLCIAATPLPGVGTSDRRVPVAAAAAPWGALARVQTELGTRCTGFLAAPLVAVTAAHCLWLPKVARFIQPDSVHVLLGYAHGQYRAHARVARFVIPPGYDPRLGAAAAGLDRAVLLLDHPIGAPGPFLPVATALPAAGTSVRLGGYEQDRDEIVVMDPACRVLGLARDARGHTMLVHDCEATRGSSGAPLLARTPEGGWQAVGVEVAARAGGTGGLAAPLAP